MFLFWREEVFWGAVQIYGSDNPADCSVPTMHCSSDVTHFGGLVNGGGVGWDTPTSVCVLPIEWTEGVVWDTPTTLISVCVVYGGYVAMF